MTKEKNGFKYRTIRMTKASQFKMLEKYIKEVNEKELTGK